MSNWLEIKLSGLDYNEKLGRVENNLIYLKELIEHLSNLDLSTIKDFELQFKDLKIEFEKLVLNFDTFKADIETIIQKNITDIQKEQKDFENKILSLIEKSAIPGEIKAFGEVDKEALIKIGWKQLEIENGYTLVNAFDNGQKIGVNTAGHIAKHTHTIKDPGHTHDLDGRYDNLDEAALKSDFNSEVYVSPAQKDLGSTENISITSVANKHTTGITIDEAGLNSDNLPAGLFVNYFIFDPKDIYDPKTGLLKK